MFLFLFYRNYLRSSNWIKKQCRTGHAYYIACSINNLWDKNTFSLAFLLQGSCLRHSQQHLARQSSDGWHSHSENYLTFTFEVSIFLTTFLFCTLWVVLNVQTIWILSWYRFLKSKCPCKAKLPLKNFIIKFYVIVSSSLKHSQLLLDLNIFFLFFVQNTTYRTYMYTQNW